MELWCWSFHRDYRSTSSQALYDTTTESKSWGRGIRTFPTKQKSSFGLIIITWKGDPIPNKIKILWFWVRKKWGKRSRIQQNTRKTCQILQKTSQKESCRMLTYVRLRIACDLAVFPISLRKTKQSEETWNEGGFSIRAPITRWSKDSPLFRPLELQKTTQYLHEINLVSSMLAGLRGWSSQLERAGEDDKVWFIKIYTVIRVEEAEFVGPNGWRSYDRKMRHWECKITRARSFELLFHKVFWYYIG